MDVSLEELIRKKKAVKKGKFQPHFKPTKSPQKNGTFKPKPKLKVGDARLKIIQQNRTKLVDARDKLAQLAKKTDARFKLQKLRKQNANAPATKRRQNVGNNRFTLSTSNSGQISLSSKKDFARRPVALQRSIKNDFRPLQRGLPMHRTIVNDEISPLSRMPPLPDIAPIWDAPLYRSLAPVRKAESIIPRDLGMRITVKQNLPPVSREMLSDEDGDFPMMSPPRMSYPPTRKRPVRALSPEPERMSMVPRGYTMSSANSAYYSAPRQRMRTQTIDLTDSVHSRLDVSPPPTRSMGILASGGAASRGNMSVNRSRPQQSQSSMQEYNSPQGYRIVVSNLQSNVTQEDIKELFEDVGELLESRLVRPGTAEVIFKTLNDAQRAVDVYHNRQLDGQPMKCLLVNPRLGNRPTAPALRPASHLRAQHGTTRKAGGIPKSSIEPDIETFHSVMFKRR